MFTLKRDKVETFDFKLEGDRTTYKVPMLKYLSVDEALAAKDLADGSDEDMVLYVKSIFDAHIPGIAGKLTTNEFGELAKAYFEASGVDMGE